ncbi:hypothetical protein BJX99DRAFT_99207 [Aspergillus californicus]
MTTSTLYKIQTSTCPSLLPPKTRSMIAFLESFYQTSDTESAHEAYVKAFTPDATLKMGPKTAHGADEILTLRHGLWTHVASRKHAPTKVFFASGNELMLYGTVRYVLKKDLESEVEVEWAGRVVFETDEEGNLEKGGGKDGEGLKMKFYQVYLDPSAQSGKK